MYRFFFTAFPLIALSCASAKDPNLVVILTDDQGYHDVGFNGCTDIPTRTLIPLPLRAPASPMAM
jgi:hypothetical protein